MPVLGSGGKLELRRETPDPVTIAYTGLESTAQAAQLSQTTLWPGDKVTIFSERGLPINSGGGVPLCPGGMGMFPGTVLYRHPSWTNNTTFFPTVKPASFWPSLTTQTSAEVYVGIDQLNRVSFYTSRAAGLNGGATNRITLASVNFASLTITSSQPDWLLVCNIPRWTLNTEAATVDQTGLGARFGESLKTLLTGGGDLEFFVDRRTKTGTTDPTILLSLLLMLERGCIAEGRFWMINDRAANRNTELLPGDCYYEAKLLIVGASVQTAAPELISGSARFITTGEIRLKVGLD